jgi:hypothetical protein
MGAAALQLSIATEPPQEPPTDLPQRQNVARMEIGGCQTVIPASAGLAAVLVRQQEISKEKSMQRLIVTTAAVTMLIGANIAASPAKAEMYYGGVKNGGMCYVRSPNFAHMGYGSWQACPDTAARAQVPAHRLSAHHATKPAPYR